MTLSVERWDRREKPDGEETPTTITGRWCKRARGVFGCTGFMSARCLVFLRLPLTRLRGGDLGGLESFGAVALQRAARYEALLLRAGRLPAKGSHAHRQGLGPTRPPRARRRPRQGQVAGAAAWQQHRCTGSLATAQVHREGVAMARAVAGGPVRHTAYTATHPGLSPSSGGYICQACAFHVQGAAFTDHARQCVGLVSKGSRPMTCSQFMSWPTTESIQVLA